jgi:aspartyl-tRNA(Asn)/glutamyl-tRNA(Gln) amidotransferase subunit C
MSVPDADIDKLAKLSMLEFDDASKTSIRKDMEKIIQFIAKLDELDTKEVQPLLFVNEEVNLLREDEHKSEITKEEALKNSPKKDSDYFRVPKVMR